MDFGAIKTDKILWCCQQATTIINSINKHHQEGYVARRFSWKQLLRTEMLSVLECVGIHSWNIELADINGLFCTQLSLGA